MSDNANMSDTSNMPDALDNEATHPWQALDRVMTEDDANDGRDLALQLRAKFIRTKGRHYAIKADDMPSIIKNPRAFPVNNRTFNSKLAQTVLNRHRVLSKHFLSYVSNEDDTAYLLNGQPNVQATRDPTAKDRARVRDDYQCNVLKRAFPEMAHAWPFSATGSTLAVAEMRDCFVIMKTWMGIGWHRMWLPYALQLAGFEGDYNLFALDPFVHKLFDNGIIAFQSHKQYDQDGKFYAKIIIQWLPVCSPLTKATAILDKGPRDVVARLFEEVEAAFNQGFLPRRPAQGAGSIWLRFKDGQPVESGHSFDIGFPTREQRDYYADMIAANYEVMLLLTLRGKTKGFPPLVGDDDDDDGNGRGKGKGKGKGKQRASSPGSPAASVSDPVPLPVSDAPIATRTRYASRFLQSTASSRAKITPRKE